MFSIKSKFVSHQNRRRRIWAPFYFCLFFALFTLVSCSLIRSRSNSDYRTEKLDCPFSDGNYLLARTHRLRSVYVSFSEDQLISRIIESIDRQKLGVELNVLIGQKDWEAAWQGLQKYRKHPNINFFVTPTTESFWVQDYLEIGINLASEESVFVEMPYWERGAEAMPTTLALWKQYDLIPAPQKYLPNESHGNGDYGGNVEALPSGDILVGDNMAKSLRRHLAKVFPRQKQVAVPVSWLETGHVDELFSIIPTAKNTCGFVVAYASPQLALDLLLANPTNDTFLPTDYQIEADGHGGYPFEGCAKSNRIRNCRNLIKANRAYAEQVQIGVDRIRESLRPVCPNVEWMQFPQLFHPSRKRKVYGSVRDEARPLFPNAVNNIILGADVIYAEQFNKVFAKDVAIKLESVGLTPRPMDASMLHSFRGGIHCASLTAYSCKRLNVPK